MLTSRAHVQMTVEVFYHSISAFSSVLVLTKSVFGENVSSKTHCNENAVASLSSSADEAKVTFFSIFLHIPGLGFFSCVVV